MVKGRKAKGNSSGSGIVAGNHACEGDSIQDAIDYWEVNAGDTIIVHEGIIEVTCQVARMLFSLMLENLMSTTS